MNNLVTNAYHAMPEGGTLRIGARVRAGKVVVTFTDTGSGISKEDISKIFEPLFSTRARGIGLGLSVSRNLIEANGGTISVESEEGKGAIFTITLLVKD